MKRRQAGDPQPRLAGLAVPSLAFLNAELLT